jgi:hypothetical protein
MLHLSLLLALSYVLHLNLLFAVQYPKKRVLCCREAVMPCK